MMIEMHITALHCVGDADLHMFLISLTSQTDAFILFLSSYLYSMLTEHNINLTSLIRHCYLLKIARVDL